MREHKGSRWGCQNGMTLVEIIVSIAILGLIIVSFLPLFSTCARAIAQAAGKTINLFNDQKKLEVVAATKSGVLFADGSFVPLKDGDFPVNFPGQTTKNITGTTVNAGDLNEFLAGVPRIKLNPYILDEGYPPTNNGGSTKTVNIEGRNTHFIPGVTTVELRDRDGNRLYPAPDTLTLSVINKETATLTIPTALTNAHSPYDIRLTTVREVAETLLPVNLPQMMIVGDGGTILVSSDIGHCTYWEQRILPSLTTKLHSVAYLKSSSTDQRWIIAGDAGFVITLENEAGWEQQKVGNRNWNSIAKGSLNGSDLLVMVGDDGQIINSDNGKDWNWSISPTTSNLKRVFWGGPSDNQRFWAVGEGGTILSSADGRSWTWINQPVPESSLAASLHPVLWLDAGYEVSEREGKVQRWNDRSGNNHDAASIPPVTIPGPPETVTYFGPELTANQVNGKPAIRFDEANDRLTINHILAGGTSGRTIFMVTKPVNNRPIIVLNSNSGDSFCVTPEIGVNISTSPNRYIKYQSGLPGDRFSLLTISNAPNAPVRDITGYINGTGQHTSGIEGGNDQINVPGSETYIGGNPSAFFDGYIAEIIVFDRKLNFGERKQVEGYLAGKYGLSIGETLNAITWGESNDFMTAGANGTIARSDNGSSWEARELLNAANLYGIVSTKNLVVGCGNNGTDGVIFTSDDGGNTWNQRKVPPYTSDLLDIIHCDYDIQFMAVSSQGEILVSADGSNWNTKKLLLLDRQLDGINIR